MSSSFITAANPPTDIGPSLPVLVNKTINGIQVMRRLPHSMGEFYDLRRAVPGVVIVPGSVLFSHSTNTLAYVHPTRGSLFKHLSIRPFVIDFATPVGVIYVDENCNPSHSTTRTMKVSANAKRMCKMNKGFFIVPVKHRNFDYTIVPSFFMKSHKDFTKVTHMVPSIFYFDEDVI